MKIHTYWKPELKPNDRQTKVKVQEIRESLRDSVHMKMQSDQKVGAFLSGGVDSSAIVAFAKEVDPNIKTFTVGFERPGYSEIDVAKETAEQLNVENIHYVIQPEEFVGHLRQIVYHLDQPVADPAAVPLYFLAREAKKHVDIVLSGEGADELFGGYNIYREPNDLKVFTKIPKQLKGMLKKTAKYLPEGVKGKSFIERGTTDLQQRFIGNAKIFSEAEKKHLLKNYNKNFPYTLVTRSLYEEVAHLQESLQMQYIDLNTWLRGDILVKTDRMTAAHLLEVRAPFLNVDLFDIASQLRADESITRDATKHALREALHGIVPDSVLHNRKLGFPVPIRHWLQDELYEWAKELIETSPIDHLIEKNYVLELLESHRLGKVDQSRKLWTVISFMIWHEVSMEE